MILLQILTDVADSLAFDNDIAAEFGYAVTGGSTFLGVPVLEKMSFLNLLLRFGFNLLVSWILVHFLYYRKKGRREYYLTFLAFSAAMFLLIFLMESVKLQIGLTLGLFAIFGVIRYRTETVPVREMTYLFVIIAISVINGLALNISYAELVVANILLVSLIAILEAVFARRGKDALASRIVLYDKIENIVPERREELLADLEKRLGFRPEKVEIGHVDFLKDAAWIKLSYRLQPGEESTIGNITREKDFHQN